MSILLRVVQSITYKQPAKRATNTDGGDYQSEAIELFVSLVPHAQIEYNSRKVSALCDTQKHAGGEESGETLGDAREGADDTPSESDGRKPESWRRGLENDGARNQEYHTTNVGDSQCREELVSSLF